MAKIYTKKGDTGKTDLNSGGRVTKDSLRIEASGIVDELNSFLGFARAVNEATLKDRLIEERLKNFQEELFVLGADLATVGETVGAKPHHGKKDVPRVSEKNVIAQEKLIDDLDAKLSSLKNFILPAGGRVSAILHVCRCVCRRAERLCVTLAKREKVSTFVVKYLNRLGDALFMLARWGNYVEGKKDEIWKR